MCDLLANEEIDDNLRTGFVAYVIRHNRSLAEMLAPTRRDFSYEFKRGFLGITERPITPGELVRTREHLIGDIVGQVPAKHREFLVRLAQDEPDWSLIGLPDVDTLPAVRLRMQNLARLNSKKRQELIAAHRSALGVGRDERHWIPRFARALSLATTKVMRTTTQDSFSSFSDESALPYPAPT